MDGPGTVVRQPPKTTAASTVPTRQRRQRPVPGVKGGSSLATGANLRWCMRAPQSTRARRPEAPDFDRGGDKIVLDTRRRCGHIPPRSGLTRIPKNIRGSSNGRTADSDSAYQGSNPCPRTSTREYTAQHHNFLRTWPCCLAVRTLASHAESPGSIPGRVTLKAPGSHDPGAFLFRASEREEPPARAHESTSPRAHEPAAAAAPINRHAAAPD